MPRCSLKIAFLFMLFMSTNGRAEEPSPRGTPPAALREARQCLLVTAPDWESSTGELRLLERPATDAAWQERGTSITVSLGKNGLAWGRGAVSFDLPGPKKIEGDGRAPAGVFRLGTVFGYASAAETPPLKMPYFAATDDSEAVDDPRSRYYNQLVRRSAIAEPDWNSAEKMRRADVLYRWGIFVEHNTPAIAGAGSCIFLHIWRAPRVATVGCTAMSERDLRAIIGWLDSAACPLLIQLPLAEFRRIQRAWFPTFEAK
jgi:D-alanyl-D-alanine dipeptidase